jgi:hypothetical protein
MSSESTGTFVKGHVLGIFRQAAYHMRREHIACGGAYIPVVLNAMLNAVIQITDYCVLNQFVIDRFATF